VVPQSAQRLRAVAFSCVQFTHSHLVRSIVSTSYLLARPHAAGVVVPGGIRDHRLHRRGRR
jgi:hypothetical protein